LRTVFGGTSGKVPSGVLWLPAMDISEYDDSLIVEAELPGMESKDIDVNLSGDPLTIKEENSKEHQ